MITLNNKDCLFIQGSWAWDDKNVLTAWDDEGHVIDNIASLMLDNSDDIVRSATMRLIAYAPDMYALLATLSKNLAYSGLGRNARTDIRELLQNIDFGSFSAIPKKFIAYAGKLFALAKSIAEIDGLECPNAETWTDIQNAARGIVNSIEGEGEENGKKNP